MGELTIAVLLLAYASTPLSAATAVPFPMLYNIDGWGTGNSLFAFCGDGLKVLGGGCMARTDNWLYGAGIPNALDHHCGYQPSEKQARITCVDPAYAPNVKRVQSNNAWAVATCDAGQKVIGGGCSAGGGHVFPWNMPDSDGVSWKCGGGGYSLMTATALCVDNSVEIFVKESQGATDCAAPWQHCKEWKVHCDAGQQAVSGGCEVLSSDWKHAASWPTQDRTGWVCLGHTPAKRVKVICVRTTTTTTTLVAYRFYRFTVRKIHNAQFQIAEITLGMAPNPVAASGVTAYSLGAKFDDLSSNGASKLVDGDWNTKFIDDFHAPVVLDMQSPITADSFRLVYATNTFSGMWWHPARWFFEGSADNKEWEMLHNQSTDYPVSGSASSIPPESSVWFSFATGQRSYRFFKFSILRRHADNDHLQIADFKFQQVNGNELPLAGVSVSSNQAPENAGVAASNLLDGNADTKFRVVDFANTQLTFDVGSNMALKAFGFVTADTDARLDPSKWLMEGSTDGTSWALLHQQLIQYIANGNLDRKWFAGWFPMRTQNSRQPVIMLSQKTNECPFNYAPLTREECQFASSDAGAPNANGHSFLKEWHISNTLDPKGCLVTDGPKSWFNAHPQGQAREDRYLLCKAQTTSTTTTSTTITSSTASSTTSSSTTTTEASLSIVNRATRKALLGEDSKSSSWPTCPAAELWRIGLVNNSASPVITLQTHVNSSFVGWRFLGHIGRAPVLGPFGGPSFTWRLVELFNDTYAVNNIVVDQSGNSYLAVNAAGKVSLQSHASNEHAQWEIKNLPWK